MKKYLKNVRQAKRNNDQLSPDQYIATCPFHDPKEVIAGEVDSFIFNTTEKKWHCFDCGKGGMYEEFLKEIEKVTV